MEQEYFTQLLADGLSGRVSKPRISGLSMVIDTGIPMTMMRDLFQLAADHIDFWKFGFASAAVCPPDKIMDKVSLCQEYGIMPYPGGTSLEIAIAQGKWRSYLEKIWDAGIKVLEISDGTIEVSPRLRREIIRTARKIGFTVLTEIGKKLPGSFLPVAEQAQILHGDLNSGASYVIVEGREAGVNVGVYDSSGKARDADVDSLLSILGPLSSRLIWEAPLTSQQTYYVKKLGNQVNLGNVKPLDIVTLESIRRGFRSDTLRVGLGLPEPAQEHEHPVADSADSSTRPIEATGTQDAQGPTLWL